MYSDDSQSHGCVFSEGVVALKRCGAFCERGLPLASSDLFNHRLLRPVMLHQCEIVKHFEIILVRNEIISALDETSFVSYHQPTEAQRCNSSFSLSLNKVNMCLLLYPNI